MGGGWWGLPRSEKGHVVVVVVVVGGGGGGGGGLGGGVRGGNLARIELASQRQY